MRFLYTGTVTDTLDFDGKEVYLVPETEIELSAEFENYQYFQRLITSGILKAVTPAVEPSKEAK